jgi:glycosyltransferase involved in cell wall biosynthesis/CelD/BcsL family acetyltransferase involved in cellulose biosynthesis
LTDTRLRVLLLVDRLVLTGGAERLAVQIAKRLDADRFERTICFSRWDPRRAESPAIRAAADELRAAGVEILGLERSSPWQVWTWRALWARLRRERIDVLHAHKFGSNVWGTLVGRAARVPVVVAHEHMWSFSGQRLRRFLDRHLIARGSDAFIAVSRESRRRMIELERIPPADVTYIPNGIPPAADGDPTKLRRELGIGPDDPLVGAVAVLRPEKAIDVLIRAAALLGEQFPSLRVAIAGDGPERAALEALAADLGAGDVVRFLGMRADVPDVLAGLDVAVLCSTFEGGPLALMEYMRAGKPIVATRVGGIPELIDDGVHGLLVDSGDHQQLAAAIGRLLADREQAARLGAHARERQRREFDADRMVRELERLYEDLYASRGPRLPRRRAPAASGSSNGAPLRLRAVEDFDSAADEWDRLAEASQNLFATREWASAWWQVFGDGRELKLTLCELAPGKAAAILPLYVARSAPFRMLRFIGHGPADQLGPACAPEDRPLAAQALRELVRGPDGFDLLLAERMHGGERWPQLLGGEILHRQPSPLLRVDGRSWDDLLASRSRNFREQVRRRERKLARAHKLAFRLADDPERLQDDLSDLFRLHAERWAGEQTVAFAGVREAMHRDFAARALSRGWLRLWLLELDGRTAAAWYGFRFGGHEWYYQSGRDPALERESVGFVLMVHALREAVRDGISEFRLLLGDEDYKRRFADSEDTLETITLSNGVAARAAVAGAHAVRAMPPKLRRAVYRVAGEP